LGGIEPRFSPLRKQFTGLFSSAECLAAPLKK